MIELKIGRHTYEVTEKDRFMDNGACVQLLTQSKEVSSYGQRASPLLSKRAIKEISGFERIQHKHDMHESLKYKVQIFSLKTLNTITVS